MKAERCPSALGKADFDEPTSDRGHGLRLWMTATESPVFPRFSTGFSRFLVENLAISVENLVFLWKTWGKQRER